MHININQSIFLFIGNHLEGKVIMKKVICFFVCFIMLYMSVAAQAEDNMPDGVNAKACILIEQSTGKVLSEMNADEQLPIASVTKIMTMLLIMEEIDEDRLSLDDMVTVSENAMSYGGSTMFLETGEQLSVSDMLKGIAVASANDGCVAMAEHISGSENAFVDKMNEKAEELGMKNTNFMNTNGLDEENHYSSARDVAIMSSELLKYPKITEYTSIWTDQLRGGKFELANTNKLIRFYTGANGLKTGSTSAALCCLSASAIRNDMQLIAVVLGAPTSAERFASAKALLNFGFANYYITKLTEKDEIICDVSVINGENDYIKAIAESDKSILRNKSDSAEIEKRVYINPDITAPVKKGDVIGRMDFISNDIVNDSIELRASENVNKKGIGRILKELLLSFI